MKSITISRKLMALLAIAVLSLIVLGVAKGLERMGLFEGTSREFDTFDYL